VLDHLRQKAAQALASVSSVILSSYGPAELQTSRVSSTSQDLTLYVFLPYRSDHLLNLESRPGIVATTDTWELHGSARALTPDEIPVGIMPAKEGDNLDGSHSSPTPAWRCVVEIRPVRLTLHSQTGQGNTETIDF